MIVFPVSFIGQVPDLNRGLIILLDANNSDSYPGTGTTVFDLVNSYDHTLTSTPYAVLNGVKCFDANGSSTSIIKVPDGTGPTLPTTGYTYATWARVKSSSAQYRTLFRSYLYDHPILVNTGTDDLGFWDNNDVVNPFKDSGYNVTSIEDFWVQYSVVGDSSGSIFYINGTQVGSTAFGAGGQTHWAWGAIPDQGFGYVANMYLWDRKLTQIEINNLYTSLEQRFPNPVTSNLVLYYDPSITSSYPGTGTTINDLSSNGLNGSMSSISFTSPYFSYNGSSSQVTISDNSLLEPGTGDWTMEVWVNQTGQIGSQVILGKFDPGGAAQDVSYAIRILTGGNVYANFGNGSTAVTTATYSLSANTWYQLTYVFTNVANNNIITYVNGVQQSTTTHSFTSILNTSANLYLGSYNGGEYSQWFNGKIGITRLYSSALTSSQVLQNYNTDKSKYGL